MTEIYLHFTMRVFTYTVDWIRRSVGAHAPAMGLGHSLWLHTIPFLEASRYLPITPR